MHSAQSERATIVMRRNYMSRVAAFACMLAVLSLGLSGCRSGDECPGNAACAAPTDQPSPSPRFSDLGCVGRVDEGQTLPGCSPGAPVAPS